MASALPVLLTPSRWACVIEHAILFTDLVNHTKKDVAPSFNLITALMDGDARHVIRVETC